MVVLEHAAVCVCLILSHVCLHLFVFVLWSTDYKRIGGARCEGWGVFVFRPTTP